MVILRRSEEKYRERRWNIVVNEIIGEVGFVVEEREKKKNVQIILM